jgi:hypothetical protein
VTVLSRQPGTKEARYMHLLSGPVDDIAPAASGERASVGSAESERIARLEDELTGLQKEVAELKRQLADFQNLFK